LTEGKVKGVKAVPKKEIINVASACEKTEWGSHVSELIESFSKEYGFKLRKSLLYAAKSADLSSEVRSLKASRADVMLFASYTSDAILMVKTLKAQKAHPKIIWGQDAGFEKPEFRETLGDSIQGILTRTVFLPKVVEIKKLAGQVNDLYKKKTGNDWAALRPAPLPGFRPGWRFWKRRVPQSLRIFRSRPMPSIFPARNWWFPGRASSSPPREMKWDRTFWVPASSASIRKTKRVKSDLEIVYPFDVSSADMIYPFAGF
jgi:branched-chain amino acid transport system substrate-binding protein